MLPLWFIQCNCSNWKTKLNSQSKIPVHYWIQINSMLSTFTLLELRTSLSFLCHRKILNPRIVIFELSLSVYVYQLKFIQNFVVYWMLFVLWFLFHPQIDIHVDNTWYNTQNSSKLYRLAACERLSSAKKTIDSIGTISEALKKP